MTRLYDVTLGKFDQFKRLLAEADFDGELLEATLKQPDLVDKMVGWLREQVGFGRYAHLLLSLDEQWKLLRRYNAQYWDNRLTDDDFSLVYSGTDLEHVQRVDDLSVLHVEFASLEETVEMWWRVFVGEQPDAWRWPDLKLNAKHLQLLASNVRRYEPGIHRIRINLVAHWEPTNGRTLLEVREQAAESGETLAHTEVMSAYGLHSALFREQNGEPTGLPYSDMAGTQYRTSERGAFPRALYVSSNPFGRRARLVAYGVDNRGQRWAAPVVLGELVA